MLWPQENKEQNSKHQATTQSNIQLRKSSHHTGRKP